MTRLLVFRLILITLVVGSVPGGALAGEAPGTTSALYLALGDSVAVGVGANPPAERGNVARAFAAFQANGTGVETVSNLAISGETSASLLHGGQLDRAVALIVDPATEVRIVSLSIGGNDLLRLLFGGPCVAAPSDAPCQQQVATSLSTFSQNYPLILERLMGALATRGTGGVLYVHTYYNPFSGTGAMYDAPVDRALLGADGVLDCAAAAAEPANAGLNDVIACVGESYGARVVDLHPHFGGRGLALTLIAQADIHPNDAGHGVIADVFTAAVLAGE